MSKDLHILEYLKITGLTMWAGGAGVCVWGGGVVEDREPKIYPLNVRFYLGFLSDEGPMLETLDYTIYRIVLFGGYNLSCVI